MIPEFHKWRWIVCNHSGGKDSQTMLRQLILECTRQGVDRSRVVLSHQSLGRMEWPGTLELIQQQARHYGLRLLVTKYRDKTGQEPSLLDYVRKRGMWPSSTQRYCTSEFKRGPGGRVITALWQEAQGAVLHCLGFRAEESPARERRQAFIYNTRYSTQHRDVFDCLPVHDWTLDRVWADIRESNLPYHWAYDAGMPRLSCCFCIFAPRSALLIAGKANPELLNEYCEVEIQTGHRFRKDLALVEIREAIKAGEQPTKVSGTWNM